MKQLKQLKQHLTTPDKVVCYMNIRRLFKIGGGVEARKTRFHVSIPPPIFAVPERDSI